MLPDSFIIRVLEADREDYTVIRDGIRDVSLFARPDWQVKIEERLASYKCSPEETPVEEDEPDSDGDGDGEEGVGSSSTS
jgi:hypothetical protein